MQDYFSTPSLGHPPWEGLSVQIHRPILHQFSALLEQIAPPIGRLRPVVVDVGQGQITDRLTKELVERNTLIAEPLGTAGIDSATGRPISLF